MESMSARADRAPGTSTPVATGLDPRGGQQRHRGTSRDRSRAPRGLVGERLAVAAREARGGGSRGLVARMQAQPLDRATAWVGGGETTVTVRGPGRGGRNQELALAAMLALDGAPGRPLLVTLATRRRGWPHRCGWSRRRPDHARGCASPGPVTDRAPRAQRRPCDLRCAGGSAAHRPHGDQRVRPGARAAPPRPPEQRAPRGRLSSASCSMTTTTSEPPLVLVTRGLPDGWLSRLEGRCRMVVGHPDVAGLQPKIASALPEAAAILCLLTDAHRCRGARSRAAAARGEQHGRWAVDNIDVAA